MKIFIAITGILFIGFFIGKDIVNNKMMTHRELFAFGSIGFIFGFLIASL